MPKTPAELERKVDQLDNDVEAIYSMLTTIDGKLGAHDTRFDTMDKKLDAHDARFDTIDKKLETLIAGQQQS